MNPPTTTSETLKTRLWQIHETQPELASAIKGQWPFQDPPRTLDDEWTDDETIAVGALLDRLDIEGPPAEPGEARRVGDLVATLTPEEAARIKAWVVEAAATPGGRELSLGGGWHTTRRLAIAEACCLVGRAGMATLTFWAHIANCLPDPGEVKAVQPIGAHLAHMNWRDAQHLLAIVRLHLNLNATIESENP